VEDAFRGFISRAARFVRQVRVGLGDLREEHFEPAMPTKTRAEVGPATSAIRRKEVSHGASDAYRAEFQARRKPGMRRTSASVGVDTLLAVRTLREIRANERA